jgi:hypothetical protein
VFDHNYHFDHLLDTAYEVEGGHPYHFNGGASPGEAASPLSSQGDLTELGGEPHSGGGGVHGGRGARAGVQSTARETLQN